MKFRSTQVLISPFVLGLTLILTFATANAASVSGSISFTEAEKLHHRSRLNTLLPTAARCLKDTLDRHTRFFKRYHFSPYYGSGTQFAKLSQEARITYLAKLFRKPESYIEKILAQDGPMESISCVGMVIDCLAKGFKAAGDQDNWRKVIRFTASENDSDGTALQYALRELGWRSLYWNPATQLNEKWDKDELKLTTVTYRGQHELWYNGLLRSGKYYTLPIDDRQTLVNFGTRPPYFLNRVPFWVGTAHAGYHAFAGANSRVIEAHSTRVIYDPATVESADFNPLARRNNGPAGIFRSGAIVVPPGY
jgi:hypothetical protein